MKKDEIMQDLQEGALEIIFTKKDGTERTMRATLDENMIPSSKTPKGNSVVENDNVIRCFDVEIQEWRSFRVDSILCYSKAL